VSVPSSRPGGSGDVQATFAATLVEEWERCGITDAVICPGSRSTPLALALAASERLTCHVRLDERSAGFFALGLALGVGRAVIVATTSGTAAAELHPAVIEAHYARVPLLVCTADRPPELHQVGAPQTIDQHELYGPTTRWFVAPGVARSSTSSTWRPLAARAVAEATDGPAGPGPVHLNLAFIEPLVGEPRTLPEGRTPGRPAVTVAGANAPPPESLEVVTRWRGRRGVVVAGEGCGDPRSVVALAGHLGWPVLADPRSRCRTTDRVVVGAADSILRDEGVRRALRAEVVVLLGAPWVSKALGAYVAEQAYVAEVVAVDPWWRWQDPDRAVALVVRADPSKWLAEAAELAAGAAAPPGWLERWEDLEHGASRAIDAILGKDDRLSEPALARALPAALPLDCTLVVASSMPIRDLEWFGPRITNPPRVVSNRGANGIDGVTSSALGLAAAAKGPVVAVVGDLAFFHDVSALLATSGGRDPSSLGSCTIVVVDNNGGGIFNFLPQADALERSRFEELFGAPQDQDVVAVARGFGVLTHEVRTYDELVSALAGTVGKVPLSVICVRAPEREANVALHGRLNEAVRVASAQVLAS